MSNPNDQTRNPDHASAMVCEIIETHTTITLGQLCRSCGVQAEWVTLLVEQGVIEPQHKDNRWRFPASHVTRVHTAARLHRDLDINPAGLALALDLLDQIRDLRARLDAAGERLPVE